MKVFELPIGDNSGVFLRCYIQDTMMPGMKLPGLVICPGGAYMMVGADEDMAATFVGMGYHAFVVQYSVGLRCAWPQPVVETSMAMKILHDHAEEWKLDTDKIVVSGFSAGGHVASGLGCLWNDPEIQRLAGVTGEENKPAAMLLCYPCINIDMPVFEDGELKVKTIKNEELVGPQTPPAFVVHTYGDKMVSMEQSVRFVYAMSKQDRPVEYHVYTGGEHGAPSNIAPVVTPDNNTGPCRYDWLPRFRVWLDELWNPKEYVAPPMAMPNAFTTREHFETLVCLIREGMGFAPPTLSPMSKLDAIADNEAAMAILKEYVPVLVDLKITETARQFPISAWLEHAGLRCGNPMFGMPGDPAVDECMARIQAAMNA